MLDWQLTLVGLIVAVAAVYLVRAGYQTWRGGKVGCGGKKCACPGSASNQNNNLIPIENLALRRRDQRSR